MKLKQNPDIISILPAAGIGLRMHTSIPKQYLTIRGKTLLEHAVHALFRHDFVQEIIIAIHENDCWYHQLPIATDPRVRFVIGGSMRANSVMAALRSSRAASWVLIHDAARPCLHHKDLCRLLAIITQTKIGGVLAVPARDTFKRAYSNSNIIAFTIERNNMWHALTPQLFVRDLLITCLEQALADGIILTDEASALEYCGYKPLLVPGRTDNIKVTNPEDLALATLFLN